MCDAFTPILYDLCNVEFRLTCMGVLLAVMFESAEIGCEFVAFRCESAIAQFPTVDELKTLSSSQHLLRKAALYKLHV